MMELTVYYTKATDEAIKFFAGIEVPKSIEEIEKHYQKITDIYLDASMSDIHNALEAVFNSFQAEKMPEKTLETLQIILDNTEAKHTSMSVGDVIRTETEEETAYFVVSYVGFTKLDV